MSATTTLGLLLKVMDEMKCHEGQVSPKDRNTMYIEKHAEVESASLS